jgi:hypothetical protein
MNTGTAVEQETIRQILRGERPLADLALVDMSLRIEGDRIQVENPRRLGATADIRDLARGFLTYLHDPPALRRWALFLQAADFELDLERQPAGDQVLSAMWEASFGNPITAETLATLRQIDPQSGGRP